MPPTFVDDHAARLNAAPDAPSGLRIHPTDTLAGYTLSHMKLVDGRPRATEQEIRGWCAQAPAQISLMALPEKGQWAVGLRPDPDRPTTMRFLLGQEACPSATQGAFCAQAPDIIFSPFCYAISPHLQPVLLRQADPLPPFPASCAARALAQAASLPPVVPVHAASAHTIAAPWAAGHAPAPADALEIVRAQLWRMGATRFGALHVHARTIGASGAWNGFLCTRTALPNRPFSLQTTQTSGLAQWLDGRMEAPGCPWPGHIFVGRTPPRTPFDPTKMDNALHRVQRAPILCSVHEDEPANPSAHQRLAWTRLLAKVDAW